MSIFRRFKSDERGATAMIFGLAIIPVMMAAGAAVDYGRASAAKLQLQRAVDAAALTLVKDAPNATDGELKRRGKALVKALLKDAKDLSTDRITVSREARTIRVTASGAMKTAFMAIAGLDTLSISSEAEAAWGVTNLELALVLDNTGSINETPQGKRKIDELKNAAALLLADLRGVAYERETVKVSIVPFDTEVRLDTRHRNADWLRWNQPAERQDWTGYVEDRDQPYDVTAEPATGDVKSKHRARRFSRYAGGNGQGNDIAPILPLTSVYEGGGYDTLMRLVGDMRPRGNTNVGLGVAWGLATLLRSEPFAEPLPTKPVERFMIVLTDGDNTQSLADGTVNKSQAVIDDRTRLACASARKTATVYTIRLVSGNANLLRDCATDPDKYYDVTNPAKLEAVFRSIVKEISATRLSM
jgi:Flp pilus assembly protein TadG